jgi:hypothetical protein
MPIQSLWRSGAWSSCVPSCDTMRVPTERCVKVKTGVTFT